MTAVSLVARLTVWSLAWVAEKPAQALLWLTETLCPADLHDYEEDDRD